MQSTVQGFSAESESSLLKQPIRKLVEAIARYIGSLGGHGFPLVRIGWENLRLTTSKEFVENLSDSPICQITGFDSWRSMDCD